MEVKADSHQIWRIRSVRRIPVSERLFAGRIPRAEFRVRASFHVADDHDGAAHGRCRGDGK